MSLIPDKELNILVYWSPSYVIIYRSYALSKMVHFFLAHPVLNAFLRHHIQELHTFKNGPVFLAHPVYYRIYGTHCINGYVQSKYTHFVMHLSAKKYQ